MLIIKREFNLVNILVR